MKPTIEKIKNSELLIHTDELGRKSIMHCKCNEECPYHSPNLREALPDAFAALMDVQREFCRCNSDEGRCGICEIIVPVLAKIAGGAE